MQTRLDGQFYKAASLGGMGEKQSAVGAGEQGGEEEGYVDGSVWTDRPSVGGDTASRTSASKGALLLSVVSSLTMPCDAAAAAAADGDEYTNLYLSLCFPALSTHIFLTFSFHLPSPCLHHLTIPVLSYTQAKTPDPAP